MKKIGFFLGLIFLTSATVWGEEGATPQITESLVTESLVVALPTAVPQVTESLVTTPQAVPGDLITDYALAQKCYHTVDKGDVLGWENCIQQFLLISRNHPATDQGKKALFSVARLSHEKFKVSKEEPDLHRAFDFYNDFLKAHPEESLADDALFQIGVLRFENEGNKDRGIRAMETLLSRYPNGDMVAAATQYLHRMRSQGNLPSDSQPVASTETRIPPEMPLSRTPRTPVEIRTDVTIRTVVIDPGHGGSDTGAIGKGGGKEAAVALQVARKLAFKLKTEFGFQVHMTRTGNKTLSLDERNKIAAAKKADLFISIHANAHDQPSIAGVQTFYLDNATSQGAERLATIENRIYGKKLNTEEKILRTLRQNADTDASRDLARAVQGELIEELRREYPAVADLKEGAALFQVLDGVSCPAILVETGFITNVEEELRLTDTDYQWALADGIGRGVSAFAKRFRTGSVSAP